MFSKGFLEQHNLALNDILFCTEMCVVKKNCHIPAVYYLWGKKIFIFYGMYKSKAANTHFILSCTRVFINYSYCKLK